MEIKIGDTLVFWAVSDCEYRLKRDAQGRVAHLPGCISPEYDAVGGTPVLYAVQVEEIQGGEIRGPILTVVRRDNLQPFASNDPGLTLGNCLWRGTSFCRQFLVSVNGIPA